MKRLLACMLTLIMLLAMAVPAAAEDSPLYALLGYESAEELCRYEGITAEQYEEIAAAAKTFDPYAYFADNSWYYDCDTAEELMTGWEITEAEFAETMMIDWFYDRVDVLHTVNQTQAELTERGGVPGQVNVMLNGACLTFPDAVPEITDSRTMVPLRSAMEAIGAQVDYDHATRTAIVSSEDVSFTHVIGSRIISLADGTTVEMDVPSYISMNRTMVPLRFFSQVLGYDVDWDKTRRTAVLLDTERIAAELDSHFTILNSIAAANRQTLDPAANYREVIDLTGKVSLLDSINGDRDYAFGAALDVLFNTEAINLSGRLDLSAVPAILSQMDEEAIPPEIEPYLEELTFALILAGENGWISAPLLDYTLQEELEEKVSGAWVGGRLDAALDLGGLIAQAQELQSATFGEMLVTIGLLDSDSDPFCTYDNIAELGSLFVTMFDDSTFTRSGGGYQWRFGERELLALAESMGASEEEMDLREAGISQFSIDLFFGADGSCSYSCVLAADEIKLTISADASRTEGSMDVRMQVRNVCDVTLTGSVRLTTSAQAPMKTPPAGALVIDNSGVTKY